VSDDRPEQTPEERRRFGLVLILIGCVILIAELVLYTLTNEWWLVFSPLLTIPIFFSGFKTIASGGSEL
jgi:hypothetical protein